MTNQELLIQSQQTTIAILQDRLKEVMQQLKNEKNVRIQAESDNSRMWEMLYSPDVKRCYREGSE